MNILRLSQLYIKMDKLIDKKTRNGSFCFDTDLLYKEENIYVMDNHRTAAWCWANHIEENEKYTVIHIDKHYDTLGNQIKEWTEPINNGLKNLSFDEYDKIEYQKNKYERYKVFRWDNYIPLFHHYYSNQITEYVFYTHNFGTIPDILKKHITHCSAYNLFNCFYDCCAKLEETIIINLDIDYFFYDNPQYNLLFSESAIEKLFEGIMTLVRNKKNILTIALSPECCGGWENSLAFMRKYLTKYEIFID